MLPGASFLKQLRITLIILTLKKCSFGDKFIWLLNSESKDTLICMCDFLLKSQFRIAGISYFNTTVMSLILVFTIYMIFHAITLCFIMFICPFVCPLIWTNKILSIKQRVTGNCLSELDRILENHYTS